MLARTGSAFTDRRHGAVVAASLVLPMDRLVQRRFLCGFLGASHGDLVGAVERLANLAADEGTDQFLQIHMLVVVIIEKIL